MLRFFSAGESHGPLLTVILDGVPAGLELTAARDIDPWLQRRQGGYGRGRRMAIETDKARIVAGVRAGKTTGAPISLEIENRDWKNWQDIMSVLPGNEPRKKALTKARPGHVDLAGGIKYGHKDLRDVLERASARETASRVAAGAIAHKLLETLAVQTMARVVNFAAIPCLGELDWDNCDILDQSPIRSFDKKVTDKIIAKIDQAKKDGDTLGGIIEARFKNLPVGLGSHTQWDRKLDGRLAQAAMSIQAIKGVEIGDGWEAALNPGSQVHDAIYYIDKYHRKTNRSGGLEGGVSNGSELVIRAAMKPIATLMKPLETVDVITKEKADAARERSDTTAVPAASIVLLMMTSIVLADAIMEKFGSDTLREIKANLEQYNNYVSEY